MADLRIAGFELEYWADVAELFLAPKCCWGTLQLPFQSRDDVKQRLENPPANMDRLIALTPVSAVSSEQDRTAGTAGARERAIGLIGVRRLAGRRSHVGDIGMFVHPDYHGQGVGTALMEAAIELSERWHGLTRLELTVFVDNEPAIKLYEKFDFVVEGTLRDFARRDGELVDVLAMARLS
jgi:putative acetyltransferase